MKYIITFENFDLGRFSEDEDEVNKVNKLNEVEDDSFSYEYENDDDDDDDDKIEKSRRIWGDELVESVFIKNWMNY